MTTIKEFENGLIDLIGKPSILRPFVCDGSPIDCQVFIVGINPATSMGSDFWGFWRAGAGFDKKSWLDAYNLERKNRPLEPGKKRRLSTSPTRRAVEWIIDEAKGLNGELKFLETNIYSLPTRRAAQLKPDQKTTEVFDFLLNTIKPQIILAHGGDAVEYMQKVGFAAEKLIQSRHFSARGFSQEEARALGRKIKSYMQTR